MNNLHNIVVYIKDEAMLQEAREMLLANGHNIATDGTFSLDDMLEEFNHLYYYSSEDYWMISISECGEAINTPYPTGLNQTLGDVTIQDYSEGYKQAITDLEQAIKANPKLTAKQILENLKKEI